LAGTAAGGRTLGNVQGIAAMRAFDLCLIQKATRYRGKPTPVGSEDGSGRSAGSKFVPCDHPSVGSSPVSSPSSDVLGVGFGLPWPAIKSEPRRGDLWSAYRKSIRWRGYYPPGQLSGFLPRVQLPMGYPLPTTGWYPPPMDPHPIVGLPVCSKPETEITAPLNKPFLMAKPHQKP
jgi:hypothetical protein